MQKSISSSKPMLAWNKAYDVKDLTFPLVWSPKIDGVRAINHDGSLKGRSLKPIANKCIRDVFEIPATNWFDGELVLGNPWDQGLLHKTSGLVRRHDDSTPIDWWVFDMVLSGPYLERYDLLCELVELLNHPRIHLVEHGWAHNLNQLKEAEHDALLKGYEGLILRSPYGPYKHGRSTFKEGYLLKLKQFQDGEAVVLDIVEAMLNTNEAETNELGRTFRSKAKDGLVPKGMMGSLHVRDLVTQKEFFIGSGFTEAERVEIFNNPKDYIGQISNYRFFERGTQDLPREPIHHAFRNKDDL